MTYGELTRLYFDRSAALQWYWTVYVVVIGGLLAFSSLRQRPDLITGVLVTLLYCFFAYKNLGAIRDVTGERHAVLAALKEHRPSGPEAAVVAGVARQRELIEPTLVAPPYPGIRNFHIASDALTVAALWAMEWRRWRKHREDRAAAAGAAPQAV
jgi:hypothetical protein